MAELIPKSDISFILYTTTDSKDYSGRSIAVTVIQSSNHKSSLNWQNITARNLFDKSIETIKYCANEESHINSVCQEYTGVTLVRLPRKKNAKPNMKCYGGSNEP